MTPDIGYDRASTRWDVISPQLKPKTLDFAGEYALVGEKLFEILNAAKRTSTGKAPSTIHARALAVRKLCSAISRFCPDSPDLEDWTGALTLHLSQEQSSQRTRWGDFNIAAGLIREIARFRQEQVPIQNPFSRKTSRTTGSGVPGRDDVEELVRFAKQDALAYLKRFRKPDASHEPFIAEAREIAARHGGVFPVSRRGEAPNLLRHWRRSTGLASGFLLSHLYPSADDLVPFLVLLCYGLAGNPDSVALMRRDAMRSIMHPAYGECFQLQFEVQLEKRRAGSIPQYLIRDRGTLSTYWVVQAVLELTESTTAIAHKRHKNYAFLAMQAVRRSPAPLLGNLRANAINRYCKRYGLPTITLASLRKRRGLNEYEKTGDPFRVKQLLNQADFAVTTEYLEYGSTTKDEAAIADVQAGMLEKKRHSRLAESAAVKSPSHVCANPNEAAHGLDQHGFCESLLWPFNDRHFVFDFNPRSVAFLLRDYSALCEAQERLPDSRFKRRFYDVKKRIIEQEILPMISDELRQQASEIMATLPEIGYLD